MTMAKSAKVVAPKRSPLEQKVVTLIGDLLGVDDEAITSTASLVKDLGADSLDQVELVIALEEEFGVVIDDAEWERPDGTIDTLAEVLALLEKKKTRP